jgi:Cdc6-like AAA superfamily ATPase
MQSAKRRKVSTGRLVTTQNAPELIGREQEFSTIFTAVQYSLNKQKPCSIFISGKPGTGKTFTVDSIVRELGRRKALSNKLEAVIHTNALQASSANDLFALLAGKLLVKAPAKRGVEAQVRARLIRDQSKIVLLVIDEIDGLFINDKEWLYRLYSLPFEMKSKLLLITIANSVDLGSRMMPNLASRGHKPLEVVFKPYSAEEAKNILISRYEENCDPKVIEFSARQCAKKGDIRLALELCSRTDEEGKSDLKAVLQAVSARTPKHTMLQSLPHVQQLTLAACVSLGFEQSLKVSELYNYYSRKCKDIRVDSLSHGEFNETLRSFEAYGFVHIDVKADFRNSHVQFSLSPDDLRQALADNVLVSNVLNY